MIGSLFSGIGDAWMSVDELLAERHYLGVCKRSKLVYRDCFGVLTFSAPASRHLPKDWLELSRWCIVGGKNAGSMQWSAAVRWIRQHTAATTIVSYSDPSQGHTGALYRACNWLWAPTWHRLRPPPTGGGAWDGATRQSPKDRWVFPLSIDTRRVQVLRIRESGLLRRYPCAEYSEPMGASYKKTMRLLAHMEAG